MEWGWTESDTEQGPWLNEPDKMQWVDEDTDYDCLIVRNRMGGLCGYVGVPPTHPWHGVGYDDVIAGVHGGLTFAGLCQEDADVENGEGVCHIPLPGREPKVWWLGFDCCHFMDYSPAMEGRYRKLLKPEELATYTSPFGTREQYRDVNFVKEEISALAFQAKAAELANQKESNA